MASSQKQNLLNKTALGADVSGESFNIPAKGRKLIAFISASNVDAATTIEAKVQHSPDKANWFDYISFTNIVGADGSEVKLPSVSDSPVLPFLRAQVTLTGVTKLADISIDLYFENI